jgi:hypothetical protein
MAILNAGDHVDLNDRPRATTPVKSIASIAAILFAMCSFIISNAAGKMVVAVVAVGFGLVGMLRAASPRVSGGILSMVAIVLAIFGFVVAIIDAIF